MNTMNKLTIIVRESTSVRAAYCSEQNIRRYIYIYIYTCNDVMCCVFQQKLAVTFAFNCS